MKPFPANSIKGRGAQSRVANRYEPYQFEADGDHLTEEDIEEELAIDPATKFYEDATKTIISENSSPDIPFRYSINPYRGCEHGCSYCYARPSHEFLGLNPAIDFEATILVKPKAAELFRQWLARPSYQPATVAFSGVTDCYQPVERRLKLTRACIAVAAECRQPIGIVTKNALVARDLDLLAELARHNAVRVALSIPTLDPGLSRVMEPRTSSPSARLRAIQTLSKAGVPTHVMAAPIIPGLTDSEMPAILAAAREAGARTAGHTLLRLPAGVREVFLDWLETQLPEHADRVTALIRSTRGGNLNSAAFGQRHRGAGAYADHIAQAFGAFSRKLGYETSTTALRSDSFRPPIASEGQLRLF